MISALASKNGWNQKTEGSLLHYKITLDSGIDVSSGIKIAPGTFSKNNKRSP